MGYLRNINEFVGTVVGGNAAVNVFGASSHILYQAGMSRVHYIISHLPGKALAVCMR